MSKVTLNREQAHAALDLADRDAAARHRLVDAFGSPDAVEVLREWCFPHAAERAAHEQHVERLRHAAFARTTTPEDELAAADAHRQLAAAEAERLDRAAALARAVTVVLEPVAHPPVPHPGEFEAASVPVERRRGFLPSWRTWILPSAVALAVGVLASGGATAALAPKPPAPTSAPTFTPGSSPLPSASDLVVSSDSVLTGGPGNLEAALRWFDRKQSPEDLADFMDFDDRDLSTVRLVHSSAAGNVWVRKDEEGRICLEAMGAQEGSGTCMHPADFQTKGLTASTRGPDAITVLWDGLRVTISVFGR